MTDIGPEEGLNAVVKATVQDPSGYIYFGTSQGLIQYDGSTLELFANDPNDSTSIGTGEVYSVLVGSDSLIWVGTRFGSLNSFDPVTEKFRRYPVPQLSFQVTPTVHGLLEDKEGRLWAGGNHFQLLLLDKETGRFTSYQPDWIDPEEYGKRLTITNIIQDVHDKNVLWLAVLDYVAPDSYLDYYGFGVVAFDKKTGKFTSYPNSGRITVQDSSGKLYGIVLPGSVSHFNPATGMSEILPYKNTHEGYLSRSILPMENKYWMATAFSIQEMTPDGRFEILYEQDQSNKNLFIALNADNNGNVWISSEQGVRVVNPNDQHIRYFSVSMFGSNLRIYPGKLAFDSANNTVYMAHSLKSFPNRCYRIPLDPAEKTDAEVMYLDYNVSGFVVDESGSLWIAGDGKMYTSKDGEKPDKFTDLGFGDFTIPWLWNMRKSRVGWIAGIGIDTFFWFHPRGNQVRYLTNVQMPAREGDYHYNSNLMGFKYGRNDSTAYLVSSIVHQLDLYSGEAKVLYFDKSFNPYGQEIMDIEEDQDGNLWIGSVEYLGKFKVKGDSLVLLDQFSVKDGLASSQVTEIQFDDNGRLWLFTIVGINCLDPETREVRYFGVNEGLPQAFIDPREVIKTPDGRIITVNSSGIIVFHPDSLWPAYTPRAAPVVLKAIRINGNQWQTEIDVDYLDRLEAPLGNNVIDIAFQGLAYPTDKHLRYSYRLDPKSNWIDIGRNKLVTLPALTPGAYTFQVKAGKPSVDTPIRSLAIVVPTPFYLQTWFFLVCLLAIIATVYAIYRYRIGNIRREEEKKTEMNKHIAELELKALRSQMNPHFMFNSLNSIKDFILHAHPEKAAEYLSEFAHLIRLILQNSRKKSITLRDELETLMIYIELEQLRFDNKFDFNCIVDESVNLDDVHIPPMLLQPYIENAIWHGLMHKKEKGSLMLNFSKNGSTILCMIDDDGIGRQRAMELKSLSATRYKSMGMGITRDRIEIMNNMQSLGIAVEVEDKTDDQGLPTGTRVSLRIPLES